MNVTSERDDDLKLSDEYEEKHMNEDIIGVKYLFSLTLCSNEAA